MFSVYLSSLGHYIFSMVTVITLQHELRYSKLSLFLTFTTAIIPITEYYVS